MCSSDLTWQPWVDALKGRYRVIRFDQIGHGLTGPDPDSDYSIPNFVSDIDEVADRLGLDRFVIGGNSMGGGHAVAYALAHPDRVEGLILVDAAGAPIRKEGKGNIGFTIARTPVVNRIMNHITPRAMIEQSLRETVSNQAIVTDAMVDRYWELLRYPGNRDATRIRFSGEWNSFSQDEMATIDAPALVIWGEEDGLIPVEAGLWYDRYLPNSTLVVYEDIGHLPQEEEAQRSADYVAQWLSREVFSASASPSPAQ